jgi:hypothetical protein
MTRRSAVTPTDIDLLGVFSALDVSEVAVPPRAAAGGVGKVSANPKLKPLDMDELIAFLAGVRSVFASIRLSVNLTAGSGILHGGMHHGSVMTSRRACVSN